LAYRLGQDLAIPALAYRAMPRDCSLIGFADLWPLGMCKEASRFVEEAIAHASRTEHVPTMAYA
jgi:hypothetical protein